MARKGKKTFKSRNRNVSSSGSHMTSVRTWLRNIIVGSVKWVRDTVSSQLSGILTPQFAMKSISSEANAWSTLEEFVEERRTKFHRIPSYVLSDILLPFLTIRDIGNVQMCTRSLRRLIEEACELTATIYINRSRSAGTPLHVGSYMHRVPFSLPLQTDYRKPLNCCRNLSIVCSLVHFGPLLSQQRQDIRPDYMSTLQSDCSLGSMQFLDEHMRASVVDWMVEVSVEFAFAPSILHCAVQLLDVMLSALPMPRSRFQLLGCVALLVRSRGPSSEPRGPVDMSPMTAMDVVYMCDSQYTLEEVAAMVSIAERHQREDSFMEQAAPMVAVDAYDNLARSPTEMLPGLNTSSRPTTLSFLAPLCAVLNLPLIMYQQLEIEMPAYMNYGMDRGAPSPSAAEHVLLAIFLADLSLLDYQMLKYSPFTISNAIICLTRLTLHHYATGQLLLTPYGVADGKSRELKQLIRTTSRRLYITDDANYLGCPFGCEWMRNFIMTCDSEKAAVRQCIDRLWMIHADYFGHVFQRAEQGSYTPLILQYHTHMFSGIRDKFAARGSNREAVWQRLGVLPRQDLEGFLDRLFTEPVS